MKTDLKEQVVGIHYYGQVIIMQQHGKTMYACMYRGFHADFLNPKHDLAHGAQVVEVDVVEALQKQNTNHNTLGKWRATTRLWKWFL